MSNKSLVISAAETQPAHLEQLRVQLRIDRRDVGDTVRQNWRLSRRVRRNAVEDDLDLHCQPRSKGRRRTPALPCRSGELLPVGSRASASTTAATMASRSPTPR